MYAHTPFRPVCIAALLAVLAACATAPEAGRQPPPTASAAAHPEPPEGVFTVQGCEPRSLIPSAVEGSCGRRVVGALFTGLVTYDPETWRAQWGAEADGAMARAITSVDARRWTIRLKEGWTFHDGEPVTARSFVEAWNHAAYGPNAQPNAALFSPIEGFEEMRCRTAGCEEPDSRRLTGLRVVGEHTLEVTLTEPRRTFPWLLGHVAFAPLPSVAFEDLGAYGEAPVGNGPFRMEGTWEHDRLIALRRVEDHAGEEADSTGVEIRIMGPEEAWQAFLAGDLDLLADLPDRRVDEAYRRFSPRFVERPGSHYTFLVAPSHLSAFDDDRLPRALSMAIDRRRLIQRHLEGTAVPARSVIPSAVPLQGPAARCGTDCTHDPERARRLLAREGGLPDGGLTLWYPRSADYEPWIQAIADQWVRTFHLPPDTIRLQPLPFSQFLAHAEDRRIDGPYRLGWLMDVPSPRDFLRPLHGRDGLLNLDGYRNAAVEQLLDDADTAPSLESSLELYGEAAARVLGDWHHIPLWFERHQVVHSPRVEDVSLTPHGDAHLPGVTVGSEGTAPS